MMATSGRPSGMRRYATISRVARTAAGGMLNSGCIWSHPVEPDIAFVVIFE